MADPRNQTESINFIDTCAWKHPRDHYPFKALPFTSGTESDFRQEGGVSALKNWLTIGSGVGAGGRPCRGDGGTVRS